MSIGPTLTFDKSFLESLNFDEAFWLDNFFMTNIAPIFYIETLADLEKVNKGGKIPRSSEEIVKEVADKSPIIGSVTNAYHRELVIGDLLGKSVEMSQYHRPIMRGGLYKISPTGDIHIHFDQNYESERQQRWRNHEFLDVERDVALGWRDAFANMDLTPKIDLVLEEIPNNLKLSKVEDIKTFVDKFIKSKYNQFIHFSLAILDIPDKYRGVILKRWYNTRPLPFDEFAPYAAYVLSIDLLFYISINRGFLSVSHKNKTTNIIDLSYLYYLPFCSVFVSSDNFHSRLAPLFMDDEQTFVPGIELKEDLKHINEYYLKFKVEIDKVGSMRFAPYPPFDIDTLVGHIFDKYRESWRQKAKTDRDNIYKPIPQDKDLLKRIKNEAEQSGVYNGPPIPSDEVKSMSLKRLLPVKKGPWRILPEGIENKKPDNN